MLGPTSIEPAQIGKDADVMIVEDYSTPAKIASFEGKVDEEDDSDDDSEDGVQVRDNLLF